MTDVPSETFVDEEPEAVVDPALTEPVADPVIEPPAESESPKPAPPAVGSLVTFSSAFSHELGNAGVSSAPAIVTGIGEDGSLGLTIFRYGADPLAIMGVTADGVDRSWVVEAPAEGETNV